MNISDMFLITIYLLPKFISSCELVFVRRANNDSSCGEEIQIKKRSHSVSLLRRKSKVNKINFLGNIFNVLVVRERRRSRLTALHFQPKGQTMIFAWDFTFSFLR